MIISDYEYFLLFNNTSGTFSIFIYFLFISVPLVGPPHGGGSSVCVYIRAYNKPFTGKSLKGDVVQAMFTNRTSGLHNTHTHTYIRHYTDDVRFLFFFVYML